MRASTWLERAQIALREQGVPERRQVQFLEELQDHLTDLQEANMSGAESSDLGQTMGNPEPLAQALAENYRRERLLVRHPWLACLAFTTGPLALHWLVTLALSCLVMIGLFCVLQTPAGDLDESMDAVFRVLVGVFSTLAGVVVTAWFCVAARRNRLSWRMSLLGSVSLTMGTLLLANSYIELAIVASTTAAAALTTWYWSAWRGQRWRSEPISLSRRYPVLVSGPGSVLAAIACVAGYLVLTMLLLYLLTDVFGRPRQSIEFTVLALSCKYVPFALAALLCWRMTLHCHQQRLYSLVACACVAVVATAFTAGVTHTAGGESTMQFGIAVGNAFHWSLLAQFATPLAVWIGLMFYARHPRRLQIA
jgi:hypothetical protein